MKLGKSAMYLKLFHEGIKYLEEAEVILKICLGENHALVTQEIPRLNLIANEDIEILIARRLKAYKTKMELMETQNQIQKYTKCEQKPKIPIWETDKLVLQAERNSSIS